MGVKTKAAKKDMTKAELIAAITAKTKNVPAKYQPAVKHDFLNGLKNLTNTRLQCILFQMKVTVDKDGYDIYTP